MFLSKKNPTNSKSIILIILVILIAIITFFFINKINIPAPNSLKEYILNKSNFI